MDKKNIFEFENYKELGDHINANNILHSSAINININIKITKPLCKKVINDQKCNFYTPIVPMLFHTILYLIILHYIITSYYTVRPRKKETHKSS